MYKNLKIKSILILLILGFAVWKAYPLFDQFDDKGKLIKEGKLNLGLDLRGGMYLVLEVDTSTLEKDAERDAPVRVVEILRNRLDPQGVKEYPIYLQGRDRIVIQLPGETDRETVLRRIETIAHLEFKIVSDDLEKIKAAIEGKIPDGYELLTLQDNPILLEKKAVLTGDALTDARVEFSQRTFGAPYVSLTFNSKGAQLFSQVTGQNVNKRLAILLDGVIQSAPVIRERIPSGRAQITGKFSVEEANDLAIVLRAGALPAPIKVIEERTVGPTLGKDSITKGMRSIIFGGIVVLSFMMAYYLIAGMVANVSLCANLILILGILSFFKATLTLPGIAGLVLTVGMAVDANILIYERIKEELKAGKSLHSSIVAGFDRAFLAIFDSNITTLISGLILFYCGTGPVRGFATTLCIGIITTLFTGVIVTRVIFDNLVQKKIISNLRMLNLIKPTKIDFMGKRRITTFISLVIIVSGLVMFAKKGDKNFGIDFTGGTVQQFKFSKPIEIEKIRSSLQPLGLADASIQKFGGGNEIIVRTFKDTSKEVNERFKQDFPDNPFEVTRVEKVGAAIGKDLGKKAALALLYSFIGMWMYVSMRFQFKYALGGIIALFHDVLVSVAFLAFTNREISLEVIAALLTIIGYSINDTIVIYDRVRENAKLMRKTPIIDVFNLSINQTLSRTVFTSMTTLFAVTALYLFGGEVINDFAFTLLVGMIAGVYSTVYIAGAFVVGWFDKKK